MNVLLGKLISCEDRHGEKTENTREPVVMVSKCPHFNVQYILGKPSQEKTGNSLVFCQTRGVPPNQTPKRFPEIVPNFAKGGGTPPLVKNGNSFVFYQSISVFFS